MTTYKQAREEKSITYRKMCRASDAYIKAIRRGTLTEEILREYESARDRYTQAFILVVEIENQRKVNNV